MGSLEAGGVIPLKRDSFGRSSSRNERQAFLQRNRSRLSRFLLFKKFDYLQWICTIAVFLFFLVLFQMFLPGSVVDKSEGVVGETDSLPQDVILLEAAGLLDFGEDFRLKPLKLMEKFRRGSRDDNLTVVLDRTLRRFGHREPRLALVFADLVADSQQLLMATVAVALKEIGYSIKVYSLEDGPAHEVWENIEVPVTIIETNLSMGNSINWLNYDGVLVNSFGAKSVLAGLTQEPFKSLPLILTVHETALAIRSGKYNSSGQYELLNDWKKVFNRANVVVFPNFVLPLLYSEFDSGNYYVIPGYPADALRAHTGIAWDKNDTQVEMGYSASDLVIAVVGTQFLYRGSWLEHALILKALRPLFADSFSERESSSSRIKIMILTAGSASNYSVVVETISLKLNYPSGVVKHVAVSDRLDSVLHVADIVIYGCFLEEQSFPEILMKAMSLEKLIVAPDLSNIKNYVDDRVNGYLFPKENIKILTQILLQVISNAKLSPLARNVASIGRSTAKNLMAKETIEGYILLLENVLKFPSEVALPKTIEELSPKMKEQWQWHLFQFEDGTSPRSDRFLNQVEGQWNQTQRKSVSSFDDSFSYAIWEDEKNTVALHMRKKREDEEIKDRTEQTHRTWEEVYKGSKKADRAKNELHERDEGELERTGQLLCIYEPYFGEGTWPFLHHKSLYRGIGLSSKGRRHGTDDIDAPSRLSVLANPYYRDTLSEYGAFFAIANRIDRLHRNAWIGFQSWKATANNASLSNVAENALLHAIQVRKHGDALYFWVRMDMDSRNPLKLDFWTFCDSLNAGNCKFAFLESLKRMYGIKHDLDSLPPMPEDGDTWSIMQSWALPTRSFLEFVMFSRMFVDALDSQMYEEHHSTGHCYLSLWKDKHCYSRLLELLVNVWAYHSGRKMVYLNPVNGTTQEQHQFNSRKGKMWVKWFSYNTLKAMDEEMAEMADSDPPKRRWLWPLTGEVFWQGVYEKERDQHNRQKEKKKQLNKEKIVRMKKRRHQKVIGKYIKPPPDEETEKEEKESPNTDMADI